MAGQAAHWFDMHRAVPEMARVLRPGGSLGLIWNRIDPTSPWVIELVAILREANASRVGHGVDLSALPEGGFQRPVRQSWRFRQRLDRSVLIDLVASRSYVMRLDEKARSELLDRVESLAPAPDRFELPYTARFGGRFDGSDRIFATDEFSILPLSQSLMRTIG